MSTRNYSFFTAAEVDLFPHKVDIMDSRVRNQFLTPSALFRVYIFSLDFSFTVLGFGNFIIILHCSFSHREEKRSVILTILIVDSILYLLLLAQQNADDCRTHEMKMYTEFSL